MDKRLGIMVAAAAVAVGVGHWATAQDAPATQPAAREFAVTLYDEDARMWTDAQFFHTQCALRAALDISRPDEGAFAWLTRHDFWAGKTVTWDLTYRSHSIPFTAQEAAARRDEGRASLGKVREDGSVVVNQTWRMARGMAEDALTVNDELAKGGGGKIARLALEDRLWVELAVTGQGDMSFEKGQKVRVSARIIGVRMHRGVTVYAVGSMTAIK